MIRRAFLTLYFILCFSAYSLAKEVSFELKLEKNKVQPGKQTQLEMIFSGSDNIPVQQIPFTDGLDTRYVRSAKEDSSGTLKHIYKIAALKTGLFRIGPVRFEYGTDTYISNTVYISVEKESAATSESAASAAAPAFDISKHIFVVLDSPKTAAYVNEKVPIALRLYSDWLDLENITFHQKPRENLIAKKFEDRTVTTTDKAGVKYVVLEYRSSLYAATPGQYDLEPIEVRLEVAKANAKDGQGVLDLLNQNKEAYDEFIGPGSSRSLDLSTSPFSVKVLPLPSDNQPPEFEGAVGSFKFDASASPGMVKEGDIVTVKISITGDGNYDTVRMPKLNSVEGLKMYEPKVVKDKNSAVFEVQVRIQSPEASLIPEAIFAFFDPLSAQYQVLVRGPFSITVTAEPKKIEESQFENVTPKASKAAQANILPLKDSPGKMIYHDMHFYRNGFFGILAICPIFFMIAGLIVERRLRFLGENPEYAALIAASRKAKRAMAKVAGFIGQGDFRSFYGLIFTTLQQYLGERSLISPAGVTARIADELSAFGIESELLNKMKKIFSDCYLAKYTSTLFSRDDMSKTMEDIKDVINALDKKIFNK